MAVGNLTKCGRSMLDNRARVAVLQLPVQLQSFQTIISDLFVWHH